MRNSIGQIYILPLPKKIKIGCREMFNSNFIKSILTFPLISFIGLSVSCGSDKYKLEKSNHELFDMVDYEIDQSDKYQEEKERKIDFIKAQFLNETDNTVKSILCNSLIAEYESFISDSALYYVNLNLKNPVVSSDDKKVAELLIKKADIAAHAGLFHEAENLLSSINSAQLDTALLQKYYYAYCDLYQYEVEYNDAHEYTPMLVNLREQYVDSVKSVSHPNSVIYIINEASAQTRSGETAKAEDMLLKKIGEFKSGDRNYSILSSLLAYVYRTAGDTENYRKYLAKTVISDIQGAIKENMAIRALATECFEEGDLERADRYLRQSFSDANFYAARMRNAQSSRMLPVIGEAYTTQQKKLNHELRLLVIFISILAFGFIVISIFALIQVKKVRAINRKTKGMLDEVSALSDQLSEVNKELSTANRDLKTSNKIRGEYGALFMEYCSLAISSLQQYQQSLKVAATQGNLQNLVKKIESGNIENKTLKEFYSKFDEAILNIYPNFVENFNSLLIPEERISLKPNEGLNTELRVFALIRIGINDSEKIAKFLRCSLTTVYTYRSKMKKRAIDPENFEESLENI